MCIQTSVVFSCGHKTFQPEPCETATRLRSSKGFCNTIMAYPPRQRCDPCLNCWAQQVGIAEVLDQTKGRDDLPLLSKNHYPPVQHSRRIFRTFTPTSDPLKDVQTLSWKPQGHRYDPERKKRALQHSRTPAVKSKKQPDTLKAPSAPVSVPKQKKPAVLKQAAQPKTKSGKK